MRSRCERATHKQFKDYGGRGIRVCPEWAKFAKFAEWALSNGFSPDLELDRIDCNGDYSPGNCRWITHQENMQNLRRTQRIVVHGKEYSISAAAKAFGVHKSTIRGRLMRGKSHEEAVGALGIGGPR
jgi:hypothetical protein